jgi:hypothetical protein
MRLGAGFVPLGTLLRAFAADVSRLLLDMLVAVPITNI